MESLDVIQDAVYKLDQIESIFPNPSIEEHELVKKCILEPESVTPLKNVPAKVFTTIRCKDQDGQYPLKVISLPDDIYLEDREKLSITKDDKLYLEDKEKLLIKQDVNHNYTCIAICNKRNGKTFPLIEKDKIYCKRFHLNCI